MRDTQREQRAEPGGRNPVPPVQRAPLAADQEQPRQQPYEHVLGVQREQPKRVLEAIVVEREVVQRLEESEIDATSVTAIMAARMKPPSSSHACSEKTGRTSAATTTAAVTPIGIVHVSPSISDRSERSSAVTEPPPPLLAVAPGGAAPPAMPRWRRRQRGTGAPRRRAATPRGGPRRRRRFQR